MAEDQPLSIPEESFLLRAMQEHDGRSIRQLAPLAGITEARWRQILKGRMTVAGHEVTVVAPPATLARMAMVLGVPVTALRRAGRNDAADLLERMEKEAKAGTSNVPLPASRGRASVSDEIDLIYASKTMTARQKLQRIRMVLELQVQAEREEAGAQQEAPTGEAVEQG
jgi:hypothetical protein